MAKLQTEYQIGHAFGIPNREYDARRARVIRHLEQTGQKGIVCFRAQTGMELLTYYPRHLEALICG